MKHIQSFSLFEAQTSVLTTDQEEFLNECTDGTWSVNRHTGLVNVQGGFACSFKSLTSLNGISFGHVSGNFFCFYNHLTSLEGAPQTVGGDFFCDKNRLTSLEGAPQEINGRFLCDEFELIKGKWNIEGWAEVLNMGTEEAKKLILTLNAFNAEYFNNKLKEQPKETILQMVPIWDDLPSNIQDEIQIPSNLKDGFDNLLDLQRAGIF